MKTHLILMIFIPKLVHFSTSAQTCISHRGILPSVPENSLEGLNEVRGQGLAGIEFDIQITKDGVPILYHDPKLGSYLFNRLGRQKCLLGEEIKELNYKDIRGRCFLKNGESVPTLEQALEALEGYEGYVFVDLKQKASKKFYTTIEDSWLREHEKVWYLSFKKRALRPLKRRWPDANRILLSRYIPRGLFYEGVGFNKRLSFFPNKDRLERHG